MSLRAEVAGRIRSVDFGINFQVKDNRTIQEKAADLAVTREKRLDNKIDKLVKRVRGTDLVALADLRSIITMMAVSDIRGLGQEDQADFSRRITSYGALKLTGHALSDENSDIAMLLLDDASQVLSFGLRETEHKTHQKTDPNWEKPFLEDVRAGGFDREKAVKYAASPVMLQV